MRSGPILRGIAGLALAEAILPAPAMAQQPPPAATGTVVQALRADMLAAALDALGGKPGEATVEDGKTFYRITLPNGLPAVAYLAECSGEDCQSLILVASLAKPAERSLQQLDELLRTVNNNVPEAKVFRVGDRVVVQHYVLAASGITLGNLAEHIRLFSNVTASMFQTLNQG